VVLGGGGGGASVDGVGVVSYVLGVSFAVFDDGDANVGHNTNPSNARRERQVLAASASIASWPPSCNGINTPTNPCLTSAPIPSYERSGRPAGCRCRT